jgi:hypothetical protein
MLKFILGCIKFYRPQCNSSIVEVDVECETHFIDKLEINVILDDSLLSILIYRYKYMSDTVLL